MAPAATAAALPRTMRPRRRDEGTTLIMGLSTAAEPGQSLLNRNGQEAVGVPPDDRFDAYGGDGPVSGDCRHHRLPHHVRGVAPLEAPDEPLPLRGVFPPAGEPGRRRNGGIDEAGADGGHPDTLRRPVRPQAL